MSETQLLWAIPGLPLLAALIAACMAFTKQRNLAHLPVLIAFPMACICSFQAILALDASHVSLTTESVTWFEAGKISVGFGLAVDGLSALMLTVITFVGSFIALFSIGYMHHSGGYARYFAVLSLFVASMCLLVMADNFLVLFAGWEGVGVCSYLLVGYYFAKPAAAHAARKAFLVTRLGDIGLIIGIFLLWQATGFSLQFERIFSADFLEIAKQNPKTITAACLLIFCGAIGKSAQFPLYVWLPDAMEGPTPASALIHAATMVTAGVYLLARCAPLFVLSPIAQAIVATVGVTTAFLAAFIALTQHDLKRVLAYSTVSQLGFMFFALGCGTPSLVQMAVSAAIFHLFTHAFFKAVLFLSAGSVMHAMGDVIDMRKFSGLRKLMPVTHLTFLAGALALAGVPLLSGFWSKEAIFGVALEISEANGPYSTLYGALLITAIATAGMTAFYTFRAYYRTFWGPLVVPPEAGHHAHESPRIMRVPLIVLAVGSLAIGAVMGPLTHQFEHLIEKADPLTQVAEITHVHASHEHAESPWLLLTSIVVALGGVGLATLLYAWPNRIADTAAKVLKLPYYLSVNRLYLDEIYQFFFAKGLALLAWVSWGLDYVIDGIAQVFAAMPRVLGRVLQPIQLGLVQFYALAMVTGLVGFLCFLVLSTGR
ncbi:NADH-quinone oxidoreductase subunit L [Tuwongella immobilis]|uniref:NADH:quinone oxidoreductase/Mrp antiporter membrane subunit domain-containing protein n=1 Tax=Tuwongella immobilis TaxID=692036 RepID=A0A6C2YIU9_9BACT|nr:NADH-quinone oxidoreductase subunit L [Tuwongella immobilis]VIP00902.1 nadh dehydrogenase subunit l : Proton-translocating NADH-quinone oxidoreductase, chain L OS=Planctomyces limnophilus (strain ATCC 43296 / DSM 3776 / IFAM 1008 / 290) GN=Plim_3868 PE=4 SV=1: Oxidored_q1_N: Oxidored_q1 [Tuwongella immobilis]VTR97222.1 nadh dehydrogenase subunit l : Proton-translocating NADH-quinone oxidoreductase, chain L OS=Planctomyces limnophilus (strain ATCC 43296 / DSM 3776 / IFAM 1008 / 290) GN=Plim_386